MLKYYLLIVLAFTCQIALAQIAITYDNAGNRILRKQTTPLPVTLISFTATKVSGDDPEGAIALLNWQTASETSSDRFDIERSQDGKKWSNIGNIAAAGDKKSSSWYSFADKTPMDGENLYRLKMIDKDGTFSFSRIQSVYFDSQITFYPNPVKDRLKIKGVAGGGPVSGKVQVLNNRGQVVHNSGNIPIEGIDIIDLSSGVYLVRITHNNGSLTIKKIVKQ